MAAPNDILLAFYGDDFTGSTDALELLSKAGARTILFLTNPDATLFNQFEDIDAFGIAGMTRAMINEEIEVELSAAFSSILEYNPRHFHYKVCSTFDSSPEIGNIGTAISVGRKYFPNSYVPIVVGAPYLGRYSAFGNLYAQMSIGSEGEIYRLDRHPSMSKHPVTPAKEGDLRLHLAKQTPLKMGLVDLVDIGKGERAMQEKLQKEIKADKVVVFFDAIYNDQMGLIGSVLESGADDSTLFSVGSSGVERALGDYWMNKGVLKARTDWVELKDEDPILVLSGSASPITGSQIAYALARGFVEVEVSPYVFDDQKTEHHINEYSQMIRSNLSAGRSVIVHTCQGSEDPRTVELHSLLDQKGWDHHKQRSEIPKKFGYVLGKAAKEALNKQLVKRMIVAGGDTSSYVARVLGIEAVEMIAPAFIGAPMCRVYAKGSPLDGVQICLKGGQVGGETYFVSMKEGKIRN